MKLMYTIWATQGQGGFPVKKTKTLKKAFKYCKKHEGEASYAIEYPDGSFHEW